MTIDLYIHMYIHMHISHKYIHMPSYIHMSEVMERSAKVNSHL